jgi:hypothetical protein
MGRKETQRARTPVRRARIGMLAGLATTLIAASAGTTTPAHADPVACATVYYTINGGTPHYIVDNCYIPSPWPTQAGNGPECTTIIEDGITLKECDQQSVAFP